MQKGEPMRIIDADALINETMERYCSDCERRKGVKSGKWKIVYSIGDAPCRACGIGDMIDELEDAPTIEERKKGKWKMKPDPYGFFEEIPVCSECGCTTEMRKTYNFCPNCGADMRGGNDGQKN